MSQMPQPPAQPTNEIAVWFPTVRAGTGTDVFTERMVAGLRKRGIRAEITWLPLRAEYAPWTVPVPRPPAWATVAHVNTWLHPRFLPRHIAIIATVHHCVHDPSFRPYKSIAQALYHRYYIKRLERATMRFANVTVAVSRFTAKRTQAAFDCKPIQVIYNGVEIGTTVPASHPRTSHDPFRLLFVGTGSRRKGADLLAPIMRELGPAFELTVVGTSLPDADALPANMHVKGRLPNRKAVVDTYLAADAFLFPSRLEGFGLAAVEAMASGLPVVATAGSSLTEVVQDGVTGMLCPRDEVVAFADAARRFNQNPALWRQMSDAARARVATRFSMITMVDEHLMVYRGAVIGPRSSNAP